MKTTNPRVTAQASRGRLRPLSAILLGTTMLASAPAAWGATPHWAGTGSSDWNTAANWSGAAVPTAGDDVTIGTSSPNPAMLNTGGGSVAHLSLSATAPDSGALLITGTGALNVTGYATAGVFSGEAGALIVDGAGASFSNAGYLTLGMGGDGALTVRNGAHVVTAGIIANTATGTGAATVDGAGSQWQTTGGLQIGRDGVGQLTISNGGAVTGGQTWLGFNAGGQGTLTATGAGSTWDNGGFDARIGENGVGAATLSNGAIGLSDGIMLGSGLGAQGTLTLDHATWNSSAMVFVGDNGDGTLNLANGAQLSGTQTRIGNSAGGQGQATVDGAGSIWTTLSNLEIGYDGAGGLQVANGGAVSSQFADLGVNAGSNGHVSLSNGGAWTNSATASIGLSGAGVLSLFSGASLSTQNLIVGFANGSSGTVSIDGAGSNVAVSNVATIGAAGIGNLLLSNGGVLSVNGGAGTLTVGSNVAGTAQALIGGSLFPVAPGSIQAAHLNLFAPTAQLVFNHSATAYDFTPALSGSGLVQVEAGVTRFTADSSAFTGLTQIVTGLSAPATLIVDGSLGGNVNVNAGASQGVLTGGGAIGGFVTVGFGTLKGVQGQTLTMGSLSLASTSLVDATLGAPGGAALFNVGNTLVLDGTLNITATTGFGPGLYRLFSYGGALTDNGLNIGTTPTGSTASNFTVQTSIAGQVNIVSTASPPPPPPPPPPGGGGGGNPPPASGPLNFWDGDAPGTAGDGQIQGGAGTWSLASANWTDAQGLGAGALDAQGGPAIFAGTGGVVTVDASAGEIAVGGLQFAADGYRLDGGPLTLAAAQTTIRVGDGTSAGVGYTAVIAAPLVGAGGLVKSDLGTLILAGDNSFTGGTTVAFGRLQVGSGGTSGSLQGDVVDDAELAFARSDDVSFAGVISGSGVVRQMGPGTLTLAGANSYAGGTIIQGGALRGSAASFGSGDIQDDAALVIDQPAAAVMAQAINGTGSFTKTGAGSLNLTGASGLTGATTVAGGRLAVNGSLGASTVTVLSGATLGGGGVVGGVVADAGATVAPGNSIGHLTVAGDYVQQAGSVYELQLTSTGQSDQISVGGQATLQAGAQLKIVKLDAGAYGLGAKYAILSAQGGVQGQFALSGDTAISNFLGLVARTEGDTVYAEVGKTKAFASVAATENQAAVGRALDSLPPSSPVAAAAVLLADDAEARAAFDGLSGEIHAAAQTAAMEDAVRVREAAFARLRGAASPGIQASPAGEDAAVWGLAFGAWAHNNGRDGAARLDRSSAGLLFGADADLGGWRGGVLAGWSHTRLQQPTRDASGGIDAWHLGAYGGRELGRLALRGGASVAFEKVAIDRTARLPGLTERLSSRDHGHLAQGFGEAGWRLEARGATVEPFAGLAVVNASGEDFTERGGAAALSGKVKSQTLAVGALGVRTSGAVRGGGWTFGFGWRHAAGDVTPKMTAAFAGGQAEMLQGAPVARDALALEAGLRLPLGARGEVGLSYAGQAGGGVQDHAARASVSFRF